MIWIKVDENARETHACENECKGIDETKGDCILACKAVTDVYKMAKEHVATVMTNILDRELWHPDPAHTFTHSEIQKALEIAKEALE